MTTTVPSCEVPNPLGKMAACIAPRMPREAHTAVPRTLEELTPEEAYASAVASYEAAAMAPALARGPTFP